MLRTCNLDSGLEDLGSFFSHAFGYLFLQECTGETLPPDTTVAPGFERVGYRLTGRRPSVDGACLPTDPVLLPLDTSRAPARADSRNKTSSGENPSDEKIPEVQ